MSVADALSLAEEAFAAGDQATAARLLRACASDPGATTGQLAQIRNDLAVIAAAQGRPREADALLLGALAADPAYLPALDNLAGLCRARGDLVQATHWLRRAAEAAPEDPERRRALRAVLRERRMHTEQLGESHPANGNSRPHAVERALIVVDWFFPAVGGTERLAEGVGAALQAQRIAVEVATRPLARRTSRKHREMVIHEVRGDVDASLRAIVEAGRYDAILAFSAPTCWPLVATLRLPRPRPRTLVVPCINAQSYSQLHSKSELLGAYAELLAGADVIGYSSLGGYDVRLCEELGLSGVYLPNAVDRVAAPASRSPTAALATGGGPLLLVIGNMWPEKNHAGLLRALRDHPGDWRLAMIGDVSPELPQIAEEVRRLANEDPRVRLLGPAAPTAVAAAMDDADLLLLPSLAEATPLVLVEAMSRRLPWIATPTCGSAHDHAGGLILPLELFGEGIDFLRADPAAAAALGAAGCEHWRHSYTWEVVGPRYAKLLRGQPVQQLRPPVAARAATERVRAAFYDARPPGATREPGTITMSGQSSGSTPTPISDSRSRWAVS